MIAFVLLLIAVVIHELSVILTLCPCAAPACAETTNTITRSSGLR
jgi:hypothetical protein